MVTAENPTLLEMIKTLTPQQADAVIAFIRYLKEKKEPVEITPREAFLEFVNAHQELLRLLAQ